MLGTPGARLTAPLTHLRAGVPGAACCLLAFLSPPARSGLRVEAAAAARDLLAGRVALPFSRGEGEETSGAALAEEALSGGDLEKKLNRVLCRDIIPAPAAGPPLWRWRENGTR
eukprot:g18348.t1